MISTTASGVACCGNCGHELKVVCTGKCAEPDIVFRKDYIASLPKPKGKERSNRQKAKPLRVLRPGQCNWPDCDADIVPHSGRGRPSKKCARHLAVRRRWNSTCEAKKAAQQNGAAA